MVTKYVSSEWKAETLPIDSDKKLAANKQSALLALRQRFELSKTPKRAVLEITIKNSAFNHTLPKERLDGHQHRPRFVSRVLTYLDGKLLRDHSVSIHSGHGKSLTYLELTDEELASLKSGAHELGLLFPGADALYFVDAKLLEYTE